ncbi:MAG: adenylate/guanylate cyclase domain-containing protein [Mycobacterium sp.]
MGAASTACRICGTDQRDGVRFCDSCGGRIAAPHEQAEFKQVTVLFADVVGSMTIAAAVGAERLREIMTDVFTCAATITGRYGGTVDKFTGDGMMALFGAPVALEDHAVRACLAALEIQGQITQLGGDVKGLDGIELRLRVGLNSGRVIAGEIGSGPAGYTAIGEQVGMAQRMESMAPAGGVMVSESTARLVEDVLALGEPQWVRVKGADDPVPARRPLATATECGRVGRQEPTLVGRDWELATARGILDRAVSGHGGVVAVTGSAGIGKSRIVRETATLAKDRGVEVFTTYCESHARQIPFHVVARLLRGVFKITELDSAAARALVNGLLGQAGVDDLILFHDLLGIRDPGAALPDITSEARQRRLALLVNAASLARSTPALYVIEDLHWIDEVSEAMIAEFACVIPQARAMVLVTYRPEYRGALASTPNAHKLALVPLDNEAASALTAELVGTHPSVAALVERIDDRAAGNPFFAQEIVRDLTERGVLIGERGTYICRTGIGEVSVPPTVQATIAARIDRLYNAAKHSLNAASVIGSRFSADLLADILGDSIALEDLPATLGGLVEAELLDQVMFTPRAEYTFHHPLIRTVAYESQLKSGRGVLHRRLAAVIERRDPDSAEENAALIAEHLEAAGDLQPAYAWHMRSAAWSNYRDVGAAKTSWQRARQIADRLPADDSNRLRMQIAPRALLCGNAYRIGGDVADTGFDELRELTAAAGDKLSLAIGMTGLLTALSINDRIAEAARLATECAALIESIGEPALIVGLLTGPMQAKFQAGEAIELLRLAQRVIDLADGDATMGNLVVGSPLATGLMMRGAAEMFLGSSGFMEHYDEAIALARDVDSATYAITIMFKYCSLGLGVYLADDAALRETADALSIAQQSGDPWTLACALVARGLALVHSDGPEAEAGYDLLAKVREMALAHQFSLIGVPIVDIQRAIRKVRMADLDGAIELARAVIANVCASGDMYWQAPATSTLVEALLRRSGPSDIAEAQAAIDRLATVPTDPGFVMHTLPLLRMRALLAREHGDEDSYRQFANRYRKMATDLGFRGHVAMAEAMT